MSEVLDRRKAFAGAMIYFSRVLPHSAPNFADQAVLTFWFDQLGNYSFDALKQAMSALCSSKPRFPSIGEVKSYLGDGEADPMREGRYVSAEITHAIARYGAPNEREALANLSPTAREVVRLQGGWANICDIDRTSQLPTLRAQWRDIAESVTVKKEVEKRAELLGPRKNLVDQVLRDAIDKINLLGPEK